MAWDESQPIVSLKNVRKSFGDTEVLRGISFNVMKREVICIIGPSGSGKSTVLRCINALVPINQGSILVEGRKFMTRKWTSSPCGKKSAWCFSNIIFSRIKPRSKIS